MVVVSGTDVVVELVVVVTTVVVVVVEEAVVEDPVVVVAASSVLAHPTAASARARNQARRRITRQAWRATGPMHQFSNRFWFTGPMDNGLSERLERWLGGTLGDRAADTRAAIKAFDPGPTRQAPERIAAAIAFVSGEHSPSVALQLAAEDWRDLLVAAGLEHEDWPEVLTTRLGLSGSAPPAAPQ